MNYQRIYNKIINNRKQNIFQGHTETHHIKPRSLGGTDNTENLVDLSAREHFICHLLLTKIYPEGSVEWIKMTKAFMCMMFRQSDMQKRYLNSRWYSFYKEKFSKAQSLNQKGSGNSQYGKCWIVNSVTNEKKSIKKSELPQYLNKGWLKGRTLINKNKNRFDENGRYIRLTEEQKEFNKLQRKKVKKIKTEKEDKTYLITNKQTKEKRFVTEQELKQLDKDWISLYYNVDIIKVKELFSQGYKIQQIADYFNMSYHNFYSWYKPFKKEIQNELKEVFSKTKICPICGKEFPKYPKRKFCSTECWKKSCTQKIWVRKGNEIKHIKQIELSTYLQDEWKQVKPVPGKSSQQWKEL